MKVVKYRTQDGVFTAIRVKDGTKYIQVILMDSAGIRIRRVHLSEAKYMTDLDYPLRRAQKKFMAAAKKFNEKIPPNLKEALCPQ